MKVMLQRRVLEMVATVITMTLFVAALSYVLPELVWVALGILGIGGTIGVDGIIMAFVKSAVLIILYSTTAKIARVAVRKHSAWSSFWTFVIALVTLYVTGLVRDLLGFTVLYPLELFTYVGKAFTGLAYMAIIAGIIITLFAGIFKHQPMPHLPKEARLRNPPAQKFSPPTSARVARPVRTPATMNHSSLKHVKPSVGSWSDVSEFLRARIPCIATSGFAPLMSEKIFVVNEGLARLVENFPLLNAECSLVGCGGWGCVYACRIRGGLSVALKLHRVLVPVLEGGGDWIEAPTLPESLIRGVRSEVEAVKGLRHPNIVKLIAYSEVAPLVIYEFVEGGSLRKYLTRFRGDVKSVVLLGIQVGDALRYIHSRGLVHGDVKPGNILVSREGFVKVGDYSSVRKLLEVTSMTREATLCTPGYCAPEQVFSDLAAKAAEAGMENRVDVYQLGNLLLEALTGNVIDGIEAVKRPKAVGNSLSKVSNAELRELLKLMLNPDPLGRPSMEEVIRQLITILRT